jgi:hypothetical protein
MALFALMGGAHAQGLEDVSVMPPRIVFEGRTRGAEAMVLNRGPMETTYEILFVEMQMAPDGSIGEVKDVPAGYPSVKDMIRFSPRRVTLKPGESQAIRLALRKPPDLADGEYRSHMVVRALPPPDFGRTVEAEAAKKNDVIIQLMPVFGVSIPVIVRSGELTATAALSGLKLTSSAEGSRLQLAIDRKGNRSLYGDIEVLEGDTQVALVRGIGVYTTIDSRRVSVRLRPPNGQAVQGALHVIYRAVPEEGGATLAEADLQVP